MSKPFQQATDDGAGSIFTTFSMKYPCLPKRFLLLVFGKENMRCIETYILLFWKKKKTDQISDRLCCLSFTLELQPQPAGNFADLRGLDYSAWESSPSTRAEDVDRSQSILIDPGFFFFFNKSYITVNVFALQWFCKLQWQIACSID